jgi:hypothetical protein
MKNSNLFTKGLRSMTLFCYICWNTTFRYFKLNVYLLFFNKHLEYFLSMWHRTSEYKVVDNSALWFRKHQLKRMWRAHQASMITRTWLSLHSTCRAFARKVAQVKIFYRNRRRIFGRDYSCSITCKTAGLGTLVCLYIYASTDLEKLWIWAFVVQRNHKNVN